MLAVRAPRLRKMSRDRNRPGRANQPKDEPHGLVTGRAPPCHLRPVRSSYEKGPITILCKSSAPGSDC